MRIRSLFMLLGASLALAAGAAQAQPAGDPVAGERKAKTCLGCHGVPGYRNAYPSYRVPKLGGQHPAYIVAALNAYRTGERKHQTMQIQAAALTEQDMRDIAAFFGQTRQ